MDGRKLLQKEGGERASSHAEMRFDCKIAAQSGPSLHSIDNMSVIPAFPLKCQEKRQIAERSIIKRRNPG